MIAVQPAAGWLQILVSAVSAQHTIITHDCSHWAIACMFASQHPSYVTDG